MIEKSKLQCKPNFTMYDFFDDRFDKFQYVMAKILKVFRMY